MGLFGDLAGGLTGLFSNDGAGDANEYYKQLAEKYGKLDPKINAETVGPSALGTADPATKAAQMDALRELQTQYSKGGMDAIGQSQVAEANQSTNRNAQAQANSIQGRARASGNNNSGVTLALQEQAGQDAAERGNQQAMGAAAGAQRRQQGAVGAAGELAGNVRGQDYTAAGAEDAVNRYNSQMKMGAQQASFDNSMNQLGGQGAAYGGAASAAHRGAENKRRTWQDFGSAGDRVADAGAEIMKNVNGGGGGQGSGGGGGGGGNGGTATGLGKYLSMFAAA